MMLDKHIQSNQTRPVTCRLCCFVGPAIQDDIVLDGMNSGISQPINKGTADQGSVVGGCTEKADHKYASIYP